MVGILPCDDCNYRTGLTTCWHFGEMTLIKLYNKGMQGCEKYRLSWTASTLPSSV
jgi:hypothetical protein